MTIIEMWVTEEQSRMLEAIYEAGKSPDAEPYRRGRVQNGLVLIEFKADDNDMRQFEWLWRHRDQFGWRTRNDMYVDIMMAGASVTSDMMRQD